MTQEAFKAWWYNEGSQAPYTHHDCEEHTMRMCEIAWANGAYKEREALAQTQEPVCPDCKAKVLYECVACSSNNYPPQRKPLTDEQIFACENSVPDEIVSDRDWCVHFARAIEAAHGIKDKKHDATTE